jgi:hypothetical protein
MENGNNIMAINKHRPVLTDTEVEYLSRLLKRSYIDNLTKPPYHPDHPQDPARSYNKVHEDYCLSLMNKFSALAAKIANGIASPAYTSKEHSPQEEVLLDLGGTPPVPAYSTGTYANPGERRLAAYNRYMQSASSCNALELADAMEHRFNNDLMSIEEATAYEARMWERL